MPTLYLSSDASAPILTGVPGEFVNLLDKCLVTGYPGKAAAGWTKPFTGTNKAAFQQGAGSNGFFLRVEDGFWTGDRWYARLRGFETMTTVDAGTNLFPTTALTANGSENTYVYGSVPRPWVVLADSRTVYFFLQFGEPSAPSRWGAGMFGEFYSYKTPGGDNYRCSIHCGDGPERGGYLDRLTNRRLNDAGGVNDCPNHFAARQHDGTALCLQVIAHGDQSKQSSSRTLGVLPYPDPANGAIHLAPIYLHEAGTPSIRGRHRGIWHWLHGTGGIGSGDTFTGSGEFAGKTFLLLFPSPQGGVYCLETSDTWLTN